MKKKKRAVTLVEMMIVMFLIATIIGVVAYNYRGSLDEGKAFKTKAMIEKIEYALLMAQMNNPTADYTGKGWETVVKQSPFINLGSGTIVDAWGGDFKVTLDNGKYQVTSEKLVQYLADHPGSQFKPSNDVPNAS